MANKYYKLGQVDMRDTVVAETMSVSRIQTVADYLSVEMTGRSVSQRRRYMVDYLAGCHYALSKIKAEIEADLASLLVQFEKDQEERKTLV